MDINKILAVAKDIDPTASLIEYREQWTLVLTDKASIVPLLDALKSGGYFDMLTDITAIDWATKQPRFELVYFLCSVPNKDMLRISVPIEEDACSCQTAEGVYPSANWYEREVWDMYGITFDGHSDMRRFYMPEDFFNAETGEQYHPLRKDFPLTGIPDSLPLPPFPEKTGIVVEY
ncbi:MAG: NADH-quinone oxidoreductase subunit C [Ignavibacteria bacterium]|nr:NADH-quinone oxidoreductase subunit C [Ignavibacteria bacterium]